MPRPPEEFILDWIIAKPFEQDEGDGHHVGRHKTRYHDAEDRVESSSASKIYKREQKGYDSGDKNRVQG